jgi:choline monooxygenase
MSSRPTAAELAPTDLDRAHALPAWFYTNAESRAFEKRAIFARHWQLLAHSSQLPDVGDHLVCEIAGIPLLLVHGDDGELRALHNVCRHRAGPLALCDGRGAKALRCHYHGWTYDLAGQLRSAPEMQDAEDFDIDSIRLPQVQLRLWRGLMFAAIEPAFELPNLMHEVEQRLAQRDFSHYRFARRVHYEISCNWKVYVDNYLEGYHLPHIHPGLNRLLDYRNYISETGRWHSLQYSPMRGGENFYGEGEALYYFVWPNIMLNILPDRLQVNRVIPLGDDRCRVEFDYIYPVSEDPQEQARRTEDQRFSDEVQREDGEICMAVQQRLASGAYLPGRLNPKRESAVHHFHELLRQAWRDA